MLLHAHSGLRYLVLLMGLVVVAYAAYGLATKAEYGKHMRVLSAIFTGVIDLTVLLGVIMLFTGMFYPQLAGHIAMMILAAAVAHVVHGVMKRRPPEAQTFTPHIVGTLIVLACIVAGIMAIGRPIVG
ncbi:MAG: hypothetical protein OXU33_14230 [Gemmatimonadota bacterium]|nr:hypothetical protein [Gemmatimonadota bacterium]MDE3006529.1 hypothetical protein [Gemmatimonadota bacterium]MDE3015220.1 hypothetical protein [Gemmatimonadota bacterium]